MKIQIRKVNGVPMGREITDKGVKWGTFSGEYLEDYEDAAYPAPGFEEGEAEGELVTQKREKDNPLQKEFRDCESDESVRYPWCEYRQIWIVSTPEKVEVKEVGNWIRVEDRLPNDGDDVLTFRGKIVDMMIYSAPDNVKNPSECWFSYSDTAWIGNKHVTHWQPLPSPPTH